MNIMEKDKYIVRIKSVSINNVKNVKNGEIVFPNLKNVTIGDYSSEILGIYGQNGSGKTAMISALEIIKNLMSGFPLDKQLINLINKKTNYAKVKCVFNIIGIDQVINAEYLATIRNDSNSLHIVEEKLSYSNKQKNKRMQRGIIIETSDHQIEDLDENNAIFPTSRYESIVKKDNKLKTDLIVARKLAYEKSQSFIFSNALAKIINVNFDNLYCNIIFILSSYSKYKMFVISNERSGLINSNILMPFSFLLENQDRSVSGGDLVVGIDPCIVSKPHLNLLEKVIRQMNPLINAIIPRMKLNIRKIGEETNEKGEIGYRIELLSKRDETEVGIRYESEGIKKIISLLSCITAMYNKEDICVIVDELDAGIFEYLLREIIVVLKESGKGQLLFTSHNLIPLEVLKKDNVYFTTINESNRYIKFNSIKPNNNFRDVYLRAIELGGATEEVYEETKGYEIANAFQRAGGLLDK